jgi:hypothetical protein
MTENAKDLLIRDLCARLPYGVKIQSADENITTLTGIILPNHYSSINGVYSFDSYPMKPYLFPLSSMTEEQKKEYDSIIYRNVELHWERYYDVIDVDWYEELHDFYNKNHFDYRGLIPMGLANDATGLNIY